MRKYVLLYVLAIIGIFVEFGFLGIAGNIIFKLLIFAGISWLLYDIWRASVQYDNEDEPEPPQENAVLADSEKNPQAAPAIFDKPTLPLILENDSSALRFLLNEFSVIWGLILPNNGYLYLRGRDKTVKTLHQKHQAYIQARMEQLPFNLFELLDRGPAILIEKDIQPAANLLPFYNEEEYKPRSLLAIKTAVTEHECLFFLFDSKTPNAFNSDDIPLLETINANIISVLGKFMETGTLLATLSAESHLLEISNTLNEADSFEVCIEAMSSILANKFEASKLTIAFKNDTAGKADTAVIKKAIGIDDPFKNGYEFPLDDGLNGWVISKNKPYLIDNIDKGEYFIPRFTKEEKTNYDIKSFLSVPVEINGEAVGLITLEDVTINKYSEADKKRLQEFGRIFANAVQRFLKTNTKNGG